jgi:hypothetical protein
MVLAGSMVFHGLLHHDQPCGVRTLNPIFVFTLFQQRHTFSVEHRAGIKGGEAATKSTARGAL